MYIETTQTTLGDGSDREHAPGPVVGLLGPAVQTSDLGDRLRRSGNTVVPVALTHGAESVASASVALLACDLVVAELPAAIGLDERTAQLWDRLSFIGMPRVVVISGLREGLADYDDLAAIAQRVLGEDAVPVRLPVFDDDDQPVASLDLCRAVLDTQTGTIPAEQGHLSVAAGDLSALLSMVAALVADDAAAQEYLALLETMASSEEDQPGAPDTAGVIHLGMPVPRQQPSAVPQRLVGDVAQAVGEGLLIPIVADTAESGWLGDVATWSATDSIPADRLVRRDVDGDPTEGWAGVVLAVDGETALLRPVYGRIETGYALITAVGSDATGAPVPHRAWPTELQPLGGPQGIADDETEPRWWSTSVRMSVGDTVASGHVWLVPAE